MHSLCSIHTILILKNRLFEAKGSGRQRGHYEIKNKKKTNKLADSPRTTHLRTGKKTVKFLASSSQWAIAWTMLGVKG